MRRTFLLKTMLLLCALVAGSSSVWATDYSYTFNAKVWSAAGAQTLNNVSWTMGGTMGVTGEPYFGYDGTKGQQFGSGTYPYSAVSLSTSGISGTITSVVVNTSGANSIAGTVAVSVGGTAFNCNSKTTASLTATATAYTFTGSASGDIVISWAQTSSKAIYVKSITVTYSNGGGGSDPSISLGSYSVNASEAEGAGTINVTYNNIADVDAEVLFYESDGTTPATYDWIDAEINNSNNVYYFYVANTGAARTAYMKVHEKKTNVYSGLLTITQAAKTVVAPTFGLEGGSYFQGTELTLTSAGNTIYYTTDGSNPSNTSTEYTGPIAIATGKITYKAIAYDTDGNSSSVTSRTITGVAVATLPFEWDEKATSTTGVISTSVGTYDSKPYLKFDATGDNLILKFDGVPGTLSFDIKGNSFSSGSTSTFKVQTSADGETYSDLKTYTSLGDKTTETFNLASTVRYIKWIYTEKGATNGGNVALGNIKLYPFVAITPGKTYTTLTSANNLDFTNVSDDLKAYIATEISGGYVQMTQVNKVPAGTGLVLKATTPGSAVNVPVFDGTGADDVDGNKMKGSATETTYVGENAGYILSNGVFQPSSGGDLQAGKAYLNIAVTGSAPVLNLGFSDGDATGIDEVRSQMEEVREGIFDLSGRRVENPTKGIYIVNGKKVIIK